jgi:DNA gyrase subunit A (EC 5.99.1.3)
MFIASTHQYILFFTSKGKCYWLKVYEIPEGGRATRGRSLSNLIEFEQGETIRAYINGGSSRVDLQACKLGTGRRFTTS